MLSPLRNRFGIPGVISVIALVFAMFGGAYAASNNGGSDSGKASASAKAKKGPRGPRGPKGPAGPAGPVGPAGPAGAKGDTGAAGANGINGKDGANGANGTSVTSEEFGVAGKEGKCVGAGGSKFVAGATKTYACNGKDGTAGFPETLPSETTETGAFSIFIFEFFGGGDISFPIPLENGLDAAHVVVVKEGEEGELGECSDAEETTKGTVVNPLAYPGYLCVYLNEHFGEVTVFIRPPSGSDLSAVGADRSGAALTTSSKEKEGMVFGTWAVTAP